MRPIPDHRPERRSLVRTTTALITCLTALVACSPEQGSESNPAPHQPSPATFDLEGRWRILSIDDRPPAGPEQGERTPALIFAKNSVGGTVGCNSFGGLGLLADQHFAIHSWGSTLIGCHGELGAQEQAVSKLFFARPRMKPSGVDRVRFKSEDHALELERIGPNDSPRVPAGPEELAGTSWRIVMLDGQEASTDPARRVLRFDQGRWQGMASCATLHGTWRREGDRILVGRQIASTDQNCPPEFARIDDGFANLMLSNPRYLVGPNGELLIAGKGHALTGGRLE